MLPREHGFGGVDSRARIVVVGRLLDHNPRTLVASHHSGVIVAAAAAANAAGVS